MRIEHFALNVAEPVAMAAWYVEHLGFRVVRHVDNTTQTHFLADESGQSVLEIYCNPPDQVPDYASLDPLIVHIALVSENPDTDRARLEAAGATYASEVRLPDGSQLTMLRDPWGLALQLCKRGTPLL
ncbi:MAG: VOC family protein [Armatimonadetes bacterium]|nr:VOC family protein [Armatimonadota bacterium]